MKTEQLVSKELDEIINYNFEMECEDAEYISLNWFERYLTYKAADKERQKSCYENGKKFAVKAWEKYGALCDCDVCMLAKEVYRILWRWEGTDSASYAYTCQRGFGEMGADTINSVQYPLNAFVKILLGKKENMDFQAIKDETWNVSLNFILELYSNPETRDKFKNQITEEKSLKEYLEAYHTIGNFSLVPAHFNWYRAGKTKDYWDQSLELLKTKKKEDEWKDRSGIVQWDKKLFSSYINVFFLWDYVDPQGEVIQYSNGSDILGFMKTAREKIERRGIFMTAMLKIATMNKDAYQEMCRKIFLKKSDEEFGIYKGFKYVIGRIRELDCYKNEEVRSLIDLLERRLYVE